MDYLGKKAHDDLVSRIGSQEVLSSFLALVGGIAALDKFQLWPNVLGQKKSLHFKSGKVSYFAFTANRDWLLWYFRRPGLRDGIFTFAELEAIFPKLEFSKRRDVEKIEAVLRIQSQQDADAVLSFVKSKVAARMSV